MNYRARTLDGASHAPIPSDSRHAHATITAGRDRVLSDRSLISGDHRSYTPNRRYKDSMFRDLFGSPERRENALELYNALNGSSYDDPEVLQFTTLDDVIYLSVKNDASFLVGDELVLWEHQSTRNPNMPLRGLVYFGRLYSRWAESAGVRVYDAKLVVLPRPRYFVFYAGPRDAPDREVLKLSDAYGGEGDVEVTCTVVNVNVGHNSDLAEKSPTLAGYAEFVSRVRVKHETMALVEALNETIDECVAEDILSEYLTAKRAEVRDMFMTEYDEEKIHRQFRESGYEDGLEDGEAKGAERMIAALRAQGVDEAQIAAAAEAAAMEAARSRDGKPTLGRTLQSGGFMTEYDEEKIHRQFRESGYEDGLEDGEAKGAAHERERIVALLRDAGADEALIAAVADGESGRA